jgi:hypothetical protein
MILGYIDTAPVGVSYSNMRYIGNNNSTAPLMTTSQLSLFIKGASTDVTVKLLAAFTGEVVQQDNPPVLTDFITVNMYDSDTVDSFQSLNGLWVMLEITNASAAAVPLTLALN